MTGVSSDSDDPSLFPAEGDWERLRTLIDEADAGDRLQLSDELREYVARVARQTGIDKQTISQMAEEPERVLEVAREARRRIRSGSQRLMIALNTAFDAADRGNQAEAISALRAVIETEVVPFYREQARINLEQLGDTSVGDDE